MRWSIRRMCMMQGRCWIGGRRLRCWRGRGGRGGGRRLLWKVCLICVGHCVLRGSLLTRRCLIYSLRNGTQHPSPRQPRLRRSCRPGIDTILLLHYHHHIRHSLLLPILHHLLRRRPTTPPPLLRPQRSLRLRLPSHHRLYIPTTQRHHAWAVREH